MQWLFPHRAVTPADATRFEAAVNAAVLAGEKTGAMAGAMATAAREHTAVVRAEQARMHRVAIDAEMKRRPGQTGGIRDLAEAMLASQLPPEKRKG